MEKGLKYLLIFTDIVTKKISLHMDQILNKEIKIFIELDYYQSY